MQATLLGISIAIILALLAALVGPHFVDWTEYRAYFEGKATQLAGAPVRIGGPIDVRLLPTPMLTLGEIEIGSAAEPQAKARELHIELALGSLVRGDFRAADMRVVGPDFSLGLGADGRLAWPAMRIGFDPDMQFDKVSVEQGRITLTDAPSGARRTLDGFWFKGDVRSLLGPAKGEGGFIAAGERYGYRVAASRIGEDGTVKLKAGLDPADHPLALEADGAFRLDEGAPRFEGALTLSRPVVAGAQGRGNVAVPWRLTSKVKATPSRALFEQLEYSYGPEARAIKLTGTAELRFGKAPQFESVLSARQVDLDRALAAPDGTSRPPLAALKALLEPFAASYRPPIAVRIGIGVDAVTLAAGTLQNVHGDLKFDGGGWDVETLEFRAPGFAQVRLGGRVALAADGVGFAGSAQIDATDPRSFIAWLEGRPDAPQGQSSQLRASGDLAIGAQDFAVRNLRVEFDRKTIEGRLAYASSGARPKLDAELKAAELDIDGVVAFGRAALDGSALERPREISLAVDIGRANVAGIDVKGVRGTFRLDPAGLTFDHVRIADLADAAFSLDGRMEGALDAPRGTLTFDVDARGLDGTVAVLAKYLPPAAEPLRRSASRITPLKAHATLGIEPVSSADNRSKVKLSLEGTAGALRVKLGAEAAGDVGALTLPDFRLDGQIAASDGSALIALLGLDQAVTVDKRAGALSVTVRGASGADAKLDARLTAGGLAASAAGTTRLFGATGSAAALDLTLQAADVSPLRRGGAQSGALLPAALRAKLTATTERLALDNISGAIGGSPLRGRLALALTQPRQLSGQIDADTVDLAALVAIAAGAPKSARADVLWPGEPFGENGLGDLTGQVTLTAARSTLAPTLVGRQLRGTLRLGAAEVAFEDIEGTLAGGRASGALVLRRSAEGLTARGKIALTAADASAVLPSDGKPALAGRLGLQAEFEGNGLSPATLIGALTGAGTITLEDAQISGLDPKAFAAAIRAGDQGPAPDAAKMRDIVATVLDGGALAVPRLDAAFTMTSGQARIGQTIVYGQGADLALAAGADLADGTVEARLTLSGPMVAEGTSTTRPEILVSLKGPLTAPKRTIDVSALSGWLMLRSVERSTKQLDAAEAERRDAERREAERREIEKREAERREVERREVERREAEKREAERREADTKAITSTVPPAPSIMTDEPGSAPPRVARPRPTTPRIPPAAEQAPSLPPPLNIGPAPGAAKSGRLPRPAGTTAQGAPTPPPPGPPPPPAPRSALDQLFGVQR